MPFASAARARVARSGVAGAVVACGLVGVAASPAAADARLCADYSTCAVAGMSDHGYGSVANVSYWGMYAGHDCTNYVAYALTQEGVRRPSYVLGNAADWGPAASNAGVPVDGEPAVGAVAWWSSGAGGVSWAGHVAIVESVAAGSITVSEDNYPNGPFGWRVITTASPAWPTGFIHFGVADAPRRPSIARSGAATAVAATRSDGAVALSARTGPGGAWTTQTVVPAGSAVSAPSLVLGADGLAEIAVEGPRGSLLIYGRAAKASGWTAETVAGAGAITGAPTAVLTAGGQLQVVARGSDGGLRVYSAEVGAGKGGTLPASVGAPVVRIWTTTVVAGAGSVHARPAVTLDSAGRTRVAVLGAAHSLVLYSGRPGRIWSASTVAAPGSAFAAPSIVDGPGAQLQVATLGADGSVELFTRPTGKAGSPGDWTARALSGPGTAASAPVSWWAGTASPRRQPPTSTAIWSSRRRRPGQPAR